MAVFGKVSQPSGPADAIDNDLSHRSAEFGDPQYTTIRKPGNQELSKPALSCLPAFLIRTPSSFREGEASVEIDGAVARQDTRPARTAQ